MNKKTITLIIGLLITIISIAQIPFSQEIVLAGEATGPRSVFACDIDGDGDQDMLSASAKNDKIAWYENMDGNGSFGPQQTITNYADGAESVYACDIDGDGDQDVLSASTEDNKIAWYQNVDGNGNFGDPNVIILAANAVYSVYAGDIDGDGDFDVISASYMDGIIWYENTDGYGNFGMPQVIADLQSAWSANTIDIDGDGDLDVLASFSSYNYYRIYWFENLDGSGTFGPEQLISDVEDGTESVYPSDIDGDGDFDILSNSGWYENLDGSGDFGSVQLITTESHSTTSIAMDIDGDGDNDVIIGFSQYDNDKIAWFENEDGNGTFGDPQLITTEVSYVSEVYASDIDGDGDNDVLSATFNDGKIAWYENTDGSGAFGLQLNIAIAPLSLPRKVLSSDLDGDGDQDIISGSFGGDGLFWWENTDGNGTMGQRQIIDNDPVRDIFSCDIDGDGDNDILATRSGLYWYENLDGNGNFGPPQHFFNSHSASSVYACDLDGDGDNDALAGDLLGQHIFWFENLDGNGTFGPEHFFNSTLTAPTSVYSCDIDGDGDNDVLSTENGYGMVVWYENLDGNGNFGVQQVITTSADNVRSVYACDIDGDGDQDVLSASVGDNKIAWYENMDGEGSFGYQQLISDIAHEARSVFPSDIDGDGDIDVLSASYYSDKIAWYRNEYQISGQPQNQNICPNSDASFYISAEDPDSYQWQVDEGSGFDNLSNNSTYSGVHTDSLGVSNANISMSGYVYRCYLTYSIGNIYSNSATLTVDDDENPVITSTHDDIQIDANANCEAILPDYTADVIATDNCDDDLDITQIPVASTTISGETNTVTLTVTDDAGNTDEVFFNAEVVDIINPEISCIDDQEIILLEGQSFYIVQGTEFDPIETNDNCGIESMINDFNDLSSLVDAEIPIGTTTIIWTLTDIAGNDDTCSFIVMVYPYVDILKLRSVGISVHPNPTDGILIIEFEDKEFDKIEISNLQGLSLLVHNIYGQKKTIDLSGFENGVYLLNIYGENEKHTTKIVINH